MKNLKPGRSTNRLAVPAASMALALAGLVACSTDTSTSPERLMAPSASFDLTGNPNAGSLEVCKNGTSASFTVTFGGNFNSANVTGGITPAGGNSYTFSLTAGQCLIVYNRPVAAVTFDNEVTATVVEAAPSGGISFVSVSAQAESTTPSSTDQGARSGTVALNMFHDARVTFVNSAPAPSSCTYTKGWYRNHGSNTVIATADGLNKSQQQQVFNATPGQPGSVTWTGGNNTLNLYQQLLAAINNLNGNETAGPAAVDAAIAAAKAGTVVTTIGGGVQITLVAGTDVSGLIDTLSSFNEGSLAGFPHCGD
jgi:hypothetical protein